MQSDHDRPLNGRGRRACKLLREYVRDRDVEPQLTLCSTARRTVETVEGLKLSGEVKLEPRIYSAGAEDLLERLQQLPSELDEVMMVGHNPSMQVLVLKLAAANGPHSHELDEIRMKYPTGALSTLEFQGDWADLRPGGAELINYVRPKALQYQ